MQILLAIRYLNTTIVPLLFWPQLYKWINKYCQISASLFAPPLVPDLCHFIYLLLLFNILLPTRHTAKSSLSAPICKNPKEKQLKQTKTVCPAFVMSSKTWSKPPNCRTHSSPPTTEGDLHYNLSIFDVRQMLLLLRPALLDFHSTKCRTVRKSLSYLLKSVVTVVSHFSVIPQVLYLHLQNKQTRC